MNNERLLSHDLVSHARCCERIAILKECLRVSGLINSTLEINEVLERIMTTSRAILKADACSLLLVDEKTRELVFEVAQGPVPHQIKSGFRLKQGEGLAGHVFKTGEPLLVEDAYLDPRFHRELDRRTGYRTRSVLSVPLKIKDRVIGVSQLINRLDGAPFDREDEETLSMLCANAAVAIENARLHRDLLRRQQLEKDLDFATSIQLSFLPQSVPAIPGLRFHAHYQAASEVGGDFYDFIPLEGNRFGILIGDVAGKGVASALYMAKLTSDFRMLAARMHDPALLVGRINGLLCDRGQRGMFATLFYMLLDTVERSITYVNAGHIPPLLWNQAERRMVSLNEGGGPPVGILCGQGYQAAHLQLNSGDCLLLCTDGLVDARNAAGERFGWARLHGAVRQGDSELKNVYQRVLEALHRFVQDAPSADDTTMVLMSVEE